MAFANRGAGRAIRHRVRDIRAVPFTEGLVLGETAPDEGGHFSRGGRLGSEEKVYVYERKSAEDVKKVVNWGMMVSSAFVA